MSERKTWDGTYESYLDIFKWSQGAVLWGVAGARLLLTGEEYQVVNPGDSLVIENDEIKVESNG